MKTTNIIKVIIPQQLNKDPDITIPFDAFLLGDVIPVEVCVCVCVCYVSCTVHWGWIPYQLQHIYFLFSKCCHGKLACCSYRHVLSLL